MTARQYLILFGGFAPWLIVALLLSMWLTPKIWPMQRMSLPLFFLIGMAPVFLFLVLRLSKDQTLKDRLRQEWRASSWSERGWRAALTLWTLGFVWMIFGSGQSLILWRFRPWSPFRAVLLLLVYTIVHLALLTGVALSTRRR